MLGCCRDGGQLELPGDLHTTRQLLREAKYYQLPGLEALLEEHATALLQVIAQPGRLHSLHIHCACTESLSGSATYAQLYQSPKGSKYYMMSGKRHRAHDGCAVEICCPCHLVPHKAAVPHKLDACIATSK